MKRLLLILALAAACGPAPDGLPPKPPPAPTPPEVPAPAALPDISEAYVKLVLAVGLHDDAYVDAFYGPEAWREEVTAKKPDLAQIRADAEQLLARVEQTPPGDDDLARLRQRFVIKNLRALITRVDMLGGKKISFDEESRALYDAVAPILADSHFDQVLARLETLVPGKGPLPERVDAYKKGFIVPPEKVAAVFDAAIAECRARTRAHVELPATESFTVEYVKDKPWSAYNWYKGNFRSVIQVNTDLPLYIDAAVGLACHEGYPGHHATNVLLEQRFVRERGWVEFSVYPLYSPMSLVAEGSANYGIKVAFPGDERVAFEAKTLYPLAGLAPKGAAKYAEVNKLLDELKHVNNQAARRYLDGEIDAAAAAAFITRYALRSPERAKKLVTFIDANRSYVINYNVGEELVGGYVERQAGAGADAARRWTVFLGVIASPMLAADLQ